jgi:hypothetical protein
MLMTPLRWVTIAGIAGCGYFLITSPSMYWRAGAFVVSCVLWQLYSILMVYDGYLIMQMAMIKKRKTEQD